MLGLTIIAILLIVFLAYMCIETFRMASGSGEGLEAGILLGASFGVILYILLSSIL